MSAAELREALDNAYWPDFVPGKTQYSRAILDAARSWLKVLEIIEERERG